MGFSTVKELRAAYEAMEENDGFFKECDNEEGLKFGRNVYSDHFFSVSVPVDPNLKGGDREFMLFFVSDDLDVIQVGEDAYNSRYAIDAARKLFVKVFEETGSLPEFAYEYDHDETDENSTFEVDQDDCGEKSTFEYDPEAREAVVEATMDQMNAELEQDCISA